MDKNSKLCFRILPLSCVPGSVNQLKNKIQPLPCRQDIYDTQLAYSEGREYNYEEKQKWGITSERNIERENFSCSNRLESQFDVPIRSRPESPSYPFHLQNLSQENINIISQYSCYNDTETNKNYENIYKQSNFTTRTNSQDNIVKCSCSHDQYCPPENNYHKSSCCLHQSPVPVPKNKSNSDCIHHGSEREKKQDSEIRSSSLKRSLKDFLTPLTTVRLKPKRHTTKNAVISILNDGQVCVEFLKLKKKISYLAHVCFISHDGVKVTIFKPKKKILLSDKPPTFPDSTQEVQYFSFENLPKIHWKKYQYAKRFIDVIRAKTPKLTLYGKDAKCVMMENTPYPDYEMNFYNGFQITKIGDKITLMDQNGIRLTDESKCDAHIGSLLDVFENMKETCSQVEATLESLSETYCNLRLICFPVVLGRRPDALLTSLDDSKENATPRSMNSSSSNRTIAMKSNSDIPALKGQPSVVEEWVVAEYKVDIQMWISLYNEEAIFFNNHTRQRLSSNEHPELMERFHRDYESILFSI